VIEHGLPELPPQLTHQMSIPMCYWAAECCAEVTFIRFLRHPEDGHMAAMTSTVPYARQDGRWVPPRGNQYLLSSYAFDPVTDPDYDHAAAVVPSAVPRSSAYSKGRRLAAASRPDLYAKRYGREHGQAGQRHREGARVGRELNGDG
jgi:hypothetical protein